MPWMELSLDATHEGVDWVCTLVAQAIDIDGLGSVNVYDTVQKIIKKPKYYCIYEEYTKYKRIITMYI
jgi:ribosomal protein L11 methyltransferase